MKNIFKLLTLCITTFTILSFIPLLPHSSIASNSDKNFEHIIPLIDNPYHDGIGD